MELVSTGLTAETLEQQLSAEVTEGQCEEGLPHLSIKHTNVQSETGMARQYDQPALVSRIQYEIYLQSCVWSVAHSPTLLHVTPLLSARRCLCPSQ